MSQASAVSLTALASGDLKPQQARELVQKYVAAHKCAGEGLYSAFRAWTWRSLTERRYDSELRDWWALLRMVEALLTERRQRGYAERIQTLCDLVYESIQFGEVESIEQVTKRVHVQYALRALASGWLDRPSLKDRLGLKESNLSRLLSMLQSRGLIERQMRGRIASFRLTRAGREALRELPAPAVAVRVPTGRRGVFVAHRIGSVTAALEDVAGRNHRAVFAILQARRAAYLGHNDKFVVPRISYWSKDSLQGGAKPTIPISPHVYDWPSADLCAQDLEIMDEIWGKTRARVSAASGGLVHAWYLAAERQTLDTEHVVAPVEAHLKPRTALLSGYAGDVKKPPQLEPVRKLAYG